MHILDSSGNYKEKKGYKDLLAAKGQVKTRPADFIAGTERRDRQQIALRLRALPRPARHRHRLHSASSALGAQFFRYPNWPHLGLARNDKGTDKIIYPSNRASTETEYQKKKRKEPHLQFDKKNLI